MDTSVIIQNPFPGPQPYRAGDRGRFYGRDEMAYKLEGSILANRCLTVFGPSGAGKSSLVQASVIPSLIDAHDTRVVRVDGWPEGELPLHWLVQSMYSNLGYGDPPGDLSPEEAVFAAVKRAARGSPRPLLVYLDQVEQLLYSNRKSDESEALFECVNGLVELPLRNIRVMLSLREDYLGRFRDRLRDRRRILDHGFRVGPLTVAELTEAICQAAAAGKPSQIWEPKQIQKLMMQVRVPGQAESEEAEAQSAYAQIVCRALFQARAGREASQQEALEEIEAEPIVNQYFETTLAGLGERRAEAQRLLELHLITGDGGRTLRTENELLKELPADDLFPILRALEGAAILHAEEHQGSRYFELGHDWLAKKVYEERQARERLEEQKRREQAQQKELERQRAEAEARSAKERAQRRRLRIIAGLSLGVAGITGALGFLAWSERNIAREQTRIAQEQMRIAQEQRRIADEQKVEARDARIMTVFREMRSKGNLAWGIKMLAEVSFPEMRRGWVELASDALNENALVATLSGHRGPLSIAEFSLDSKRVLTASSDGSARIYDASGRGNPIILNGHTAPITHAAFSPDAKRVLTASEDKTVRVWDALIPEKFVVLKGHEGIVNFACFSPDGKRVLTASEDKTLRIWNADGTGEAIVLRGHEGAVFSAVFNASGSQIITASADQTVRIWEEKPGAKAKILKGHKDAVLFAAPSPDGTKIVSVSSDRTARIWQVDGRGKPMVLKHQGIVHHAAWSSDGRYLGTASADGLARVWNAHREDEPVVLRGHEAAVNQIAFSPDGPYVATASSDETIRLWRADGSGKPLVLTGHHAPIQTVAFSADGSRVLSSAADLTRGARNNNTAKIWDAAHMELMSHFHDGGGVVHSVSIGADEQTLIAARDDNSMELWQMNSPDAMLIFKGHGAWVAGVSLSPDGRHIASASFDQTLRIWSRDGKEEQVLRGHSAELRCAVYSPDGKQIVSASDDKTARIWNADGTGEARVLKGHTGWLSSASFSPDGKRVVTTSLDRTARVWNSDGSGTPIVLEGHSAEVRSAAFSPDGKRIATGSGDRSILIWNADGSGKPLALTGHRGSVVQVVWSPDGTRVASVCNDQYVRIWRSDGLGEPIILSTGGPVLQVAFVDKGQKILIIGPERSARTFMIDVGSLQKRLNTAHVDCIPATIRSTFLGESQDAAWENYAACEKQFGRDAGSMAQIEASPKFNLSALGSGEGVAKVVVLPGDAIVEVDGIVAHRRDGAIDLVGKIGEKRRLRVLKGVLEREWEVTIQETGASPSKLDLREVLSGQSAGQEGEERPVTLTPEEFQ